MSNKDGLRIAKNTAMLYFRMLLTMVISLYTSRIVLSTLGVIDFGIYNVVGGIVVMFSFLNNAMTSGTQRYFSFELGRGNLNQLNKLFCASVNIYIIIAFVIFVLSETIGLWILNEYLIIPSERMEAANWVYQLSIFSFIVTIVNIPNNALIVAYERMDVYAYISIVEVVLKLISIFALVSYSFDKLKLFSILLFLVSIITTLIYRFYTKNKFKESHYIFYWNKTLYKTLISYAGWNLWGNFAFILNTQGINVLLNVFFGPIVNAARGVTFQLVGAVNGFVSNFQIAMNPQIVKSYAAEDKYYMHQLVFQGSKYSFFLLFAIALPVILETDKIIYLWLNVIPEYSVLFARLFLINALIDSLSGTLMMAAQATGRIKKYQSVVGGVLLFNLPFSYILFKFGFAPQYTFYVSIFVSIIALIFRLYILKGMVYLSVEKFIKNVLVKVFIVVVVSLVMSILIKYLLDLYFEFSIIYLVLTCITSLISVSISILILGMTKKEKHFISEKFKQMIVSFR